MKKYLFFLFFIFNFVFGSDNSFQEEEETSNFNVSSIRNEESSVSSIIGDAFESWIEESVKKSLNPYSKTRESDVDAFICNVKSGNCVFLKGPHGVVVVDAGTAIPGGKISNIGPTLRQKFSSFKDQKSQILDIFNDIEYITFVATHLDFDHCCFIPLLAELAIERSSKVVINFCIGGEYDAVQALFQACKIHVTKQIFSS